MILSVIKLVISDPQHTVLKSNRSKMGVTYVIIKIMCPPGYHHKGSMANHALGYMMYG